MSQALLQESKDDIKMTNKLKYMLFVSFVLLSSVSVCSVADLGHSTTAADYTTINLIIIMIFLEYTTSYNNCDSERTHHNL